MNALLKNVLCGALFSGALILFPNIVFADILSFDVLPKIEDDSEVVGYYNPDRLIITFDSEWDDTSIDAVAGHLFTSSDCSGDSDFVVGFFGVNETFAFSGRGYIDPDLVGTGEKVFNSVDMRTYLTENLVSSYCLTETEYPNSFPISLLTLPSGSATTSTSTDPTLSYMWITMLSFFALVCMIFGFLMSLMVWNYFKR